MLNEYSYVILNLIVVITLMLVFLFLVKKIKYSGFSNKKYMNIISCLSVGPKEKILLVEVNQVFLLLGVTSSHIETLYSFNQLDQVSSGNQEDNASFVRIFEKMKTMKVSS